MGPYGIASSRCARFAEPVEMHLRIDDLQEFTRRRKVLFKYRAYHVSAVSPGERT